MPILKRAETFLASQSLSAGGSVTGAAVDLRTTYGTYVTGQITNGATGPSTPPEFRVEISNDNFFADVREVFKGLGSLVANAVTVHLHRILPEVPYARVRFIAGTGQGCTVVATGASVTSLG